MSTSNNTAISKQLNADSSTATFVSSITFNLVLGVVFYTVFSFVRTWNRKVYEGRTYLVEESKRSPPLSRGLWGWQRELLTTSDAAIITRVGLDAYVFIKFLRFSALIFTIFTVVGLPILMPLNSIGQQNLPGINLYTMGNVQDPSRFWGHLILSALFAITIVYFTWKEMRNFLELRQKHLISEQHSRSPTGTTILVSAIPAEINTPESLKKVFDAFPGGVEAIFLNRHLTGLPNDVQQRQVVVQKLEAAETAFIKAGVKHLQASKSPTINGENHATATNGDDHTATANGEDHATVVNSDDHHVNVEKATALPEKLRPKHRTGFFGIYGKKVDSITTYREEIVRLNERITAAQANQNQYPRLNSAFIRFRTQIAAHMASQCVVHQTPLCVTPRYVDISPEDVIWENLNMSDLQRLIRTCISYSIVTGMVLLWAIPTTFIASIASIEALASIPGLTFLKVVLTFPTAVTGIIQGILPPLFLDLLMLLVPIVFRRLTAFEGVPSRTATTWGLLNKYYFFLMVNVLFVTTLSKGIFETLPGLVKNPTSAISLLATNIPKASTFFITYVLLGALNSSGLTMLQISPLIITFIFSKFFTKTPRTYFNLWSSLGSVDFGQLIPQQTLVFAIGLIYSVIAPLVLPFVMLYFYLYYFVYMYQFLYSFNTQIETGGVAFPLIIRHIYIALFLFEILMFGILLAKEAFPQAVIMIIIIVITSFVLYLIDNAFTQLWRHVPITLADTQQSEEALFKDLSDKKRFGFIGAGAELVGDIVSLTTETVGAGVNIVGQGVKKLAAPVENTLDKFSKVIPISLREEEIHAREEEIERLKHVEKANELTAYLHPALKSEQPTIWIPHDEYGIATDLVKELEADNLNFSTIGATIISHKLGGLKVVVAEEVFEAAVGVPNGMKAPVEDQPNAARRALGAGVYLDNAVAIGP